MGIPLPEFTSQVTMTDSSEILVMFGRLGAIISAEKNKSFLFIFISSPRFVHSALA